MSNRSILRVALAPDSVSIWSSEIFGEGGSSRVRAFLERAFAVREVETVELRRASSLGRIRYGAAPNPAQIWKKLSQALSGKEQARANHSGSSARGVDTSQLFLEGPGAQPVRVSRIGNTLSTWRVREQQGDVLRLWHPRLRNRRDVVYRLEEELAALLGVDDYKASAITAEVSIRFDRSTTTPERLARELEKAWPRLLEGLDGPPSQTRLIAATGLLGLAYTAQYVLPALRPVALAGVTLYSAPNVFNAARQLTRGQVGVYALYSTGLAFMLVSGLPFTASVMATFTQFWPHLARRKLVSSQRRLFAAQRRRPTWARQLQGDGTELEVSVDTLGRGDRVVVRQGELVPVDGVVEDGVAAVVDEVAGVSQIEDRAPGERVAAGAFLRDGQVTLRVERAGAQTVASFIDSLLPRGPLADLPSSLEAERIANRNAKPALALAALSLWATRTLLPAQTVIRPDYATAPRLSAQLSLQHGIAQALMHGALFKNPAALDRLAAADTFIVADGADLAQRRVAVASVRAVAGVSSELVAGYALAATSPSGGEQSRALAVFTAASKSPLPRLEAIERHAGVARGRDPRGGAIEIASSRYLKTLQLVIPDALRPLNGAAAHGPVLEAEPADPALRPLWVSRDGELIGVISFARSGASSGAELVAALRGLNRRSRIVRVSRDGTARSLASTLDIEFHAAAAAAQAALIRDLGARTLWIGDGSEPDARQPIAASSVSVSVAPLARAREDAADILLPQRGLAALPELLELGRAHAQRLAQDYRTIYATNLLGVAGGFTAGFNGLHAGLLSNLGTGLIYARRARALDLLASTVASRRAQRRGSALR